MARILKPEEEAKLRQTGWSVRQACPLWLQAELMLTLTAARMNAQKLLQVINHVHR